MMFNPIAVIKTFGLVNVVLTAIVSLCALFLLVVSFACLFFLFGF
jgi:hypothetical protein